MNLAYPYLLELKGWRGPEHRRVQMYDLLLAVVVMIILNLAVWTLGAELVHGRGEPVEGLSIISLQPAPFFQLGYKNGANPLADFFLFGGDLLMVADTIEDCFNQLLYVCALFFSQVFLQVLDQGT